MSSSKPPIDQLYTQKWQQGLLILSALGVFNYLLAEASYASVTASTNDPATAADSPAKNNETGTQSIQLTVRKVEVSLESLRDVGLDLKHALSAIRHLYDEVTLQPVTVLTEPDFIMNGVIINIPISVQEPGVYIQPRKDRVDMLMNEIKSVLSLLNKNVEDFTSGQSQFSLPSDMEEELQPAIKQWGSLVQESNAQLNQLENLTNVSTYDNQKIASCLASLQKQVKALEDLRKSTYKLVRKEPKQADKK